MGLKILLGGKDNSGYLRVIMFKRKLFIFLFINLINIIGVLIRCLGICFRGLNIKLGGFLYNREFRGIK